MLKKICAFTGCSGLIDYGHKYCSKHAAIAEHQRKQNNKDYKAKRTDKREQGFYNSDEWEALRQQVLAHYFNLDLYGYYVNGRVVQAELVHHVVEIKDYGGWEHRLDFNNMFPCTKGTHAVIHAAYKKSSDNKAEMQKQLINLIERFNKDFALLFF